MASASRWRKGVTSCQTARTPQTREAAKCKVLVLKEGYNQRVPPIGITGRKVKSLLPVQVRVSLILYKVVAKAEEDHSIELQFQITLEWKENRAVYQKSEK